MKTYTPVRVSVDCNVAEHFPMCGLSREMAIAHAIEAYGEDGGIAEDDGKFLAHNIVWIFGEPTAI